MTHEDLGQAFAMLQDSIQSSDFDMIAIYQTDKEFGAMIPAIEDGQTLEDVVKKLACMIGKAASVEDDLNSNILSSAVMTAGLALILENDIAAMTAYDMIADKVAKIKNKGENSRSDGTSQQIR